jgi:hypothetical protein
MSPVAPVTNAVVVVVVRAICRVCRPRRPLATDSARTTPVRGSYSQRERVNRCDGLRDERGELQTSRVGRRLSRWLAREWLELCGAHLRGREGCVPSCTVLVTDDQSVVWNEKSMMRIAHRRTRRRALTAARRAAISAFNVAMSAARSAFSRTRFPLSSASACVSASMSSCSTRVRDSSA